MQGKDKRRDRRIWGAFGLRFASDVPLDPLMEVAGAPDVTITLARDAAIERNPGTDWEEQADGSVLFTLLGNSYRVSDGRRVEIGAHPDVGDDELRLWLLGSVMGALLLQRGILTLHANAVGFGDGEAAAFMGESGHGKSTLAAALSQAGRPTLCDDLLAVEIDGDGSAWVRPGIRRVKVAPDTARRLGLSLERARPVASGIDKVELPLPPATRWDRRFRLTRLYGLEKGDAFEIRRMKGVAAGQMLLENYFRRALDEEMAGDAHRFAQAMRLVGSAEAFTFVRPFDFDRLDEGLDLLGRHLDDPAA